MSRLRRVVLLRHGETEGESSIRFHGSNDVALSEEGRRQAHAARLALRNDFFDAVISSSLQRAWQSARIVAGAAPVRLESAFREVDFGRWEGLTAEEIQARDPELFAEWRSSLPHFDYPAGERRADFEKRVLEGLARIQAADAGRVLVVAHKGVIRIIANHLLDAPLDVSEPALGGVIDIRRNAAGWLRRA